MSRFATWTYVRLALIIALLGTAALLIGSEPWGPN
jgi:hypothetical protein